MNSCKACGLKLHDRVAVYCSNKCQSDQRYADFLIEWKAGRTDGTRGISTKNISGHISRYLYELYGTACTLCGWKIKHPSTGKVPLEIDHIDGNSDNNAETNLRLICPNCHALTENYKNHNNGNGRIGRRLKYIKNS
jgi:5-methylcytosine-specific restriction endonuclease McrA